MDTHLDDVPTTSAFSLSELSAVLIQAIRDLPRQMPLLSRIVQVLERADQHGEFDDAATALKELLPLQPRGLPRLNLELILRQLVPEFFSALYQPLEAPVRRSREWRLHAALPLRRLLPQDVLPEQFSSNRALLSALLPGVPFRDASVLALKAHHFPLLSQLLEGGIGLPVTVLIAALNSGFHAAISGPEIEQGLLALGVNPIRAYRQEFIRVAQTGLRPELLSDTLRLVTRLKKVREGFVHTGQAEGVISIDRVFSSAAKLTLLESEPLLSSLLTEVEKVERQGPFASSLSPAFSHLDCDVGGLHFRRASDPQTLRHVGSVMSMCVGSYDFQARHGSLIVVVGWQTLPSDDTAGIPVACLETDPYGQVVQQYKLRGNERPFGAGLRVAQAYLRAAGLTSSTYDLSSGNALAS